METDLGPWTRLIEPALARPLAARGGTDLRIKSQFPCGALHVETACFAGVLDDGGKGIACSPVSLVQLVRASAWYALQRGDGEAYEPFRLHGPKPINVAALHFADGSSANAALEARLDSLPHTDEAMPTDQTGRTFLITVNLVYAAILGHEDGHLYEHAPFCGLTTTSREEESGFFAALIRVQSSGELFKPNDPSPAELTADRCATRRIRESIEHYRKLLPAAAQGDLQFARRAAADIVAAELLVHEGTSHPHLDSSPVDGYLYPSLRILALAGELDGEEKPLICGAAAETFVQVTQVAFQAFAGKGILPDDMEAALPPGVPAAWNRTAPWSPQSFGCTERR